MEKTFTILIHTMRAMRTFFAYLEDKTEKRRFQSYVKVQINGEKWTPAKAHMMERRWRTKKEARQA